MDISDLEFSVRDEFNRRPIASKVISLLTSEIEVSPLIIDGDWGMGKSEFCHKLINLMDSCNTGHQLIYVDAYRADYADEPLLTLLAEIMKLVPKGLQQQSFFKKILPTLKFGLKAGGKGVVSHLLKQDFADVAEDFDKEIKQVSDKIIDSSVESLLKGHVEASKNLQTLQSALTELAKENPITIFVDELDRCRPDYAVAILETIKHVFDVENVQFVLVTNSTQLRASINHCYGSEVNAQRYLDKFVGFSFMLSEKVVNSNSSNSQSASVQHFINLVQLSETLRTTNIHREPIIVFLSEVIKVNNLSLRQIETFVKHVEIYQVFTEGHGINDSVGISCRIFKLLAIAIFCFEPSQKYKLAKGLVDGKALTSFVGCEKLHQWEGAISSPKIHQVIAAMIAWESTETMDSFVPNSDEVKARYDERYSESFSDGQWYIEEGERYKILQDAINTLSFGHN